MVCCGGRGGVRARAPSRRAIPPRSPSAACSPSAPRSIGLACGSPSVCRDSRQGATKPSCRGWAATFFLERREKSLRDDGVGKCAGQTNGRDSPVSIDLELFGLPSSAFPNTAPSSMAAPNFHDDDPHEAMSAVGWSDGLPVVPPTTERLERMLTSTTRPRDAVLGLCPPMYSRVTVEAVAVNAVLAGCGARHLRIVIAAVEAMLQPPFNIHGVLATTMGATPAREWPRATARAQQRSRRPRSSSRANLCIGARSSSCSKCRRRGSAAPSPPPRHADEGPYVSPRTRSSSSASRAPYHAARGFREGVVRDRRGMVIGPRSSWTATRDAALVALLGCHLAACYAPHMPLVNEALSSSARSTR